MILTFVMKVRVSVLQIIFFCKSICIIVCFPTSLTCEYQINTHNKDRSPIFLMAEIVCKIHTSQALYEIKLKATK